MRKKIWYSWEYTHETRKTTRGPRAGSDAHREAVMAVKVVKTVRAVEAV